jgi:hypothetical protein
MSERSETPERPAARRSRRDFIRSAAIGGSAVIAGATLMVPVAGSTAPVRHRSSSEPLRAALRRYGSEFGDLRETD